MARGEYYLRWDELQKAVPYVDSGGLVMYEGAILIITGGGAIAYAAGRLTWEDPFYLTSPLTGKRITVAKVPAVPGPGLAVASGEIIYISGATFPIKDETKTLTASSPDTKPARRATNIFFGCARGAKVYLRPDTEV